MTPVTSGCRAGKNSHHPAKGGGEVAETHLVLPLLLPALMSYSRSRGFTYIKLCWEDKWDLGL